MHLKAYWTAQPRSAQSHRIRALMICVISVLCSSTVPAWASDPGEPRPTIAVDAIMDAFTRFPIVALGMSHRQQDEADFSLTLIRDSRFAATVNEIVVECGNPLYQSALDRYINGGDVSIEKLQLVWRNTTQPGVCDPRQHKELLDAVRDVNKRLPAKRHIRVLAGDPPIDWDKVRGPADIAPFMTQRDAHFASVVLNQVLAHHHKALLVIGAGHVLRRPISWASQTEPPAPTVTMLIESKYPHSTYIIAPHDDFGDRNNELEPRLGSWPIPAIVELHNTWLGNLNAGVIFRGKLRRVGSNPDILEEPFPGLKLQDIADGYLYLGPIASIHMVDFPRETGTAYARELDRRRQLLGNGAMAIAPVPIPPR